MGPSAIEPAAVVQFRRRPVPAPELTPYLINVTEREATTPAALSRTT
jgi:hypothetical protein